MSEKTPPHEPVWQVCPSMPLNIEAYMRQYRADEKAYLEECYRKRSEEERAEQEAAAKQKTE